MPRYSTALATAIALLIAGCCGGDDRPRLTVFAAASLQPALEDCAAAVEDAEVRLSFAGSDELAAQIRQGVAPDVYAAANTALPDDLHAEGLVEEPVRFATNELVLAIPDGEGGSIVALSSLAGPGVTIAVGAPTVPVGAYTREVLERVAIGDAILANVRSEEPDVTGIVGKLTRGAVDAGFLYATDVAATGGELRAIELPRPLKPEVAYGAAVVADAPEPELAREYLDGLLDGPCADALRDAGFGPPPAA